MLSPLWLPRSHGSNTALPVSGFQGKFVSLEQTIDGFSQILAGKYDHLPEAAFYMVGHIEEVVEKAEMLAEQASQ